MRKTVMVIMALLIAALVSGTALASRWGRGPGYDGAYGHGPCQGDVYRGIQQLNLTAEQTAKLAELKNARTREMIPLQEKMFAKRNEIRALWLDKAPDQEKIVAAQKELDGLRAQLQEKTTTYRLESLKVLTPEQQEIAKAHYAGARKGVRNGFRGRPGHGCNNCYGPADGSGSPFSFGPACFRR